MKYFDLFRLAQSQDSLLAVILDDILTDRGLKAVDGDDAFHLSQQAEREVGSCPRDSSANNGGDDLGSWTWSRQVDAHRRSSRTWMSASLNGLNSCTKPIREKNCGYRAMRFSMPGMPMSTIPNPFSSKIERSCSRLFIRMRSASSTTNKLVGSGIASTLLSYSQKVSK